MQFPEQILASYKLLIDKPYTVANIIIENIAKKPEKNPESHLFWLAFCCCCCSSLA